MFRTYNASFTLQQQLDELTDPSDNVAAKMLSYNRANREVAILCNHQVILKHRSFLSFSYQSQSFSCLEHDVLDVLDLALDVLCSGGPPGQRTCRAKSRRRISFFIDTPA